MSRVSNHQPEVIAADNSQVETSVRVRKPRPKPVRTIAVELAASPVSRFMVVRVREGKKTDRYSVTPMPSDFGAAFTMHKLGTDDEYAVNLNGQKSSCECKGFLKHGHCRHIEGLTALASKGKLEQPAPVDATVAA